MGDTTQYSSAALLETWVTHDWDHGIQLESLLDFSEVTVQTKNTLYEITIIDGANREVLIRGGKFFPVRTPARLAGSSLGGSFLKVGGIYAGFNMEVLSSGTSIVTSPVQTIRVSS